MNDPETQRIIQETYKLAQKNDTRLTMLIGEDGTGGSLAQTVGKVNDHEKAITEMRLVGKIAAVMFSAIEIGFHFWNWRR